MEAANLIRSFTTTFAPSPEIEKIRKDLPALRRNIEERLANTRQILQEEPTFETLQAEQQIWQNLQHQASLWLNVLTARATRLQSALDHLAALQKTWTATRQAAQDSTAPGPILQQIDSTLAALESGQAPLLAQRTAVLDIQAQLGEEADHCANTLGEVAQAQHTAVGDILTRERKPIWAPDFWAHVNTAFRSRAPGIIDAFRAAIRQYVGDPSRGFPVHAAIFAALALLFCAARRKVENWQARGDAPSAAKVFERPYAAACIGFLLAASGPISPAPSMVRNFCAVLALFPMIRLIRTAVPPGWIPFLFSVGILFAVDTARQAFAAPLVGQAILVGEAIAGIGVIWFFLYRTHAGEVAREKPVFRRRALGAAAVIVMLFLGFGAAAGSLGYVRLARFVGPGILSGAVMALVVFALLDVAKGIVAFALRVWPLRLLHMVRNHRALLEKRIYRWLAWIAVLTWVSRY
ncbi:MAG TPA: hypothetical protein VLS90_07200, partial [Thermodesulfobacteriota bacterium]|nr:hypothetical protein [Thermodesulfobacteriota bacterium]